MAKMTLGYVDLQNEVSWFLGLTGRPTAPTGDNLATCKSLVLRGIRQFLYPLDETGQPHEWEFLKSSHTITTSIGQYKYALPTDFGEMNGTWHFGVSNANPPLQKRSAEQIRAMRTGIDNTGYPLYYAITPSHYDPKVGTLYELHLYPSPSRRDTLFGYYRIDPVALSADADLAVGGIRAIEAILESCLAVAEHSVDDMASSHHTQKAAQLILTLIKYDKVTTSDKLGSLIKDRSGEGSWPNPRGYFTYPNLDNVYPD